MADIHIEWVSNPTDHTEYKIYRSTRTIDPESPQTLIATVPNTFSEYVDTTAVNGLTYHYRVSYVDSSGVEFIDGEEIVVSTVRHSYSQIYYERDVPDSLVKSDENGNVIWENSTDYDIRQSLIDVDIYGNLSFILDDYTAVRLDSDGNEINRIPITESLGSPYITDYICYDDKAFFLTMDGNASFDDPAVYIFHIDYSTNSYTSLTLPTAYSGESLGLMNNYTRVFQRASNGKIYCCVDYMDNSAASFKLLFNFVELDISGVEAPKLLLASGDEFSSVSDGSPIFSFLKNGDIAALELPNSNYLGIKVYDSSGVRKEDIELLSGTVGYGVGAIIPSDNNSDLFYLQYDVSGGTLLQMRFDNNYASQSMTTIHPDNIKLSAVLPSTFTDDRNDSNSPSYVYSADIKDNGDGTKTPRIIKYDILSGNQTETTLDVISIDDTPFPYASHSGFVIDSGKSTYVGYKY